MPREFTNKILELCESGVLSWEQIAREALAEMSEDDVKDMYNTLGLGDEDE